jgi:hypothetical protein
MTSSDEIEKVQRRLETARNDIHKMAPMVGSAKQVRDYDSDRRKNLLAKHMLPHLKAGGSAAAAEVDARANASYQVEFEALATQREAAEKTIAGWDAAFASFEAARSLNSMLKETWRGT